MLKNNLYSNNKTSVDKKKSNNLSAKKGFKNFASLNYFSSNKFISNISNEVQNKNNIISYFDHDTLNVTFFARLYKYVPKICGSVDLFFKKNSDEKDFADFLRTDIIRSLRIYCICSVIISVVNTLINIIFFSEFFYFKDNNKMLFLSFGRFMFLPICIFFLYICTYIKKFLDYLEIIISYVFSFMNVSLFITSSCVHSIDTHILNNMCEISYILESSHILQLFILYFALVLFIPIRSIYLWPICATAPLAFNISMLFRDMKGKFIYSSFTQIYFSTTLSIIALLGNRMLERKIRLQYINIKNIKEKDELYRKAATENNCSNAYDEVNFFLNSTIIRINNVINFLMLKSQDLYEILLQARTDIEKCILKLSRMDNLLTVDKNALISNKKEEDKNVVEHLFNIIYTKRNNKKTSISTNDFYKKIPLSIEEIRLKYDNGDKIKVERYADIEKFQDIIQNLKDSNKINSINDLFKVDLHDKTKKNTRKLNKKNYNSYIKKIKRINFSLNNAFIGIGKDWNFNIFNLQNSLKSNTLIGVGLYFLNNYLEILKCPNYFAYNFLYDIKSSYFSTNKYHNSLHGSDVCQNMICILNNMNIFKFLDLYKQISVVIATLCHDVGHPGLTNSFLIKMNHNLSIHYNDVSILESYHSSLTFFYLKKSCNNFLFNLSNDEFGIIRQTIIDLILATDLANHFEFLSIIKIRSKLEDFSILGNESDNINFLKLCIKASDIAHTCKPFNIHLLFVLNLMLESYEQGEKEKLFNIPLMPFYDFNQIDKFPDSQVGFIKFICQDTFLELLHIENITKTENKKKELSENNDVKNYFKHISKDDKNTIKNASTITEVIVHSSNSKILNENKNYSQNTYNNIKNDSFIQKYCLDNLKYNSNKWENDKNLINTIKFYATGEITDEDILKIT
ncbi:cGMP-specific phosphodiesterase, putative [Plasmodium gallinaceum]|uniref:Phosphodiesterase n=1 Tax=Plasmodium gallinaceum TaxID=5849 RepID=A0A1J1GWC5_PLAGA|nr:cGMP-specific phosphodiesterase, putative [Plasmodium gallinaceum]CRG95605.1 cGMP-specific phosphodiesterase, putative [Plasmodium gallinaceum]